MYIITGATGNTGQHITRTLLSKGARVRVVGRDAERLKPLAALGAEPSTKSPEAFAQYVRDEITKWARIVRESGAKLD